MKQLFTGILMLLARMIYGQEKKPFFSAVVVRNIDTSIAWYSKVLELKLRNRTDAPERGFRQANLINEYMLIELIQVDSSLDADRILEKHPPKTRIRGYMKIGFVVKDIEGLYEQLKKQNIIFTGRMVTDRINNKKTFLINDPDDNLVQFFEQ